MLIVMDYQGNRWKKLRKKVLRMDEYKCQIDKQFGITTEAQTVHHIYPVSLFPQYQWCSWNLISVSNANHNRLENRKTGELTKLGKQLMNSIKPGTDWRSNKYATK